MLIPGPSGDLEARHDLAPAERTLTAVLCHPHPQYGGSMHDAVLQTAADALLAYGANCLRFNFRGVGSSSGSFDNGVGETEDLLAVINWVAEEYPRDKLWLVGYSFGASVAWRALTHCEPEKTLLIAPPVGMMPFEQPASLPGRVMAFAGDRDDFVDQATFASWQDVESQVISGADHFFSGRHADLEQAIADAIRV